MEIWREVCGFFSDPQNKGSKVRGKFRSIFAEKIRASEKSFMPTSFCRRATLRFQNRAEKRQKVPSSRSRSPPSFSVEPPPYLPRAKSVLFGVFFFFFFFFLLRLLTSGDTIPKPKVVLLPGDSKNAENCQFRFVPNSAPCFISKSCFRVLQRPYHKDWPRYCRKVHWTKMAQNGHNDHFGQNDLIPNRIWGFSTRETSSGQNVPFWPEEVRFGPFRSANRTLAFLSSTISKPTTEFAQPRLSRVKRLSSPARGYKFGCVCSYTAGITQV